MSVTEALVQRTLAAYEQTPYDSHAVREAHPARLQAIAALLGMNPAPVATARVLEIGCSSGGNLLPLAMQFPEASFVGVDLAAAQIAQGEHLVQRAGISNLTLLAADILNLDDGIGRFDYIIAHGVLSWVPPDVQHAIFAACRRLLRPQGVAYVSYNTYPGWHFREMGRAVMARAAALIDDPGVRLQKAKDLMAVLARDGCREADRPVGPVLAAHLEHIRPLPDYYLQHEYLEPVNQPFYFRDVVHRVLQQGLGYLADADMVSDMPDFLPDATRAALLPFAPDRFAMAELLDYVAGRSFRRSLLVQGEVVPDLNIHPRRALMLHAGAEVRIAQAGELNDDSVWQLSRLDQPDNILTISNPLTKAVVECLTAVAPATLDMPQLTLQVLQRRGIALQTLDDSQLQQHMEDVAGVLIRLFFINAVSLYGHAVAAAPVSDRPTVFAAARLVASTGCSILPSLQHRPVSLHASWLPLVQAMDGQHRLPQLLTLIERLANKGELVVPREIATATPSVWLRHVLEQLQQRALLVA